jgi:hypothetical protein
VGVLRSKLRALILAAVALVCGNLFAGLEGYVKSTDQIAAFTRKVPSWAKINFG